MFENEVCQATVQHIASSFRIDECLGNEAGAVGTYLLGQKYLGSDKLVVPYWVTVSYYFLFDYLVYASLLSAPFMFFALVL